MVLITVAYKSGFPFDHGSYGKTHIPLAVKNLAPLGLTRADARKVGAAADGSVGPYQVIATLYFSDIAAFVSASQQPALKEVVGHIAHPAMPDIFVGEPIA